MRLICPNCDAQYEVPDDVIPEDGRDVQCSNCGNTWFQRPAGAEQEPEPDEDAFEPEQSYAQPTDQPHAAPDQQATDHAASQRRRLDPEVASVLREEAEREARARAAESHGIESQPDLGLEETAPPNEADLRAQQARDRMARLRGETADMSGDARGPVAVSSAAAAAAASGSRREMLPDIEEINSTLRASDAPRNAHQTDTHREAAEPARLKGKSRRGFWIVILIALIAVVLYLYADVIARTVPQVSGFLDSYVQMVDAARTWLDAKILQAMQWLDSMSAEQSQPVPADTGNDASPATGSE